MIIIGDVHGCFDTLMALIEKLPKDRHIVFVGDLIDRGPKSRQVVEFVRKNNYKCVLGNHEQLALDADLKWFRHGGAQTIESYEGHEKQFEDDKLWFKSLPLYLVFDELGDEDGNKLLISHSSLGKGWSLDHKSDQFKQEAIWNRHEPPSSPEGFYNIYGHTPQKYDPLLTDHYANIDTGTYYRQGKMTALLFPEMITIQQENIDEVVFKADYMD